MVIKIYQSFLNNAVQVFSSSVSFENPTISVANGLAQVFSIGYNDPEPAMVLQFLVDETTPIDLTPPAGASSWTLTAALGFTTTLKALVNTETTKIKTSLDLRYSDKCILAVDGEQMFVTNVSHDNYLGLSYLTVERRGNIAPHYPDSEIRVVRTKPAISILDLTLGKVRISWTSNDTNAPGDYELEVTMSRLEGSYLTRWSIMPLLVTVVKDYDLS